MLFLPIKSKAEKYLMLFGLKVKASGPEHLQATDKTGIYAKGAPCMHPALALIKILKLRSS